MYEHVIKLVIKTEHKIADENILHLVQSMLTPLESQVTMLKMNQETVDVQSHVQSNDHD